ncbi:hypothetical protein PsorP6_002762 [Peronosclerospora sorghi]|uniref:Uncharacterized protein n=1 Tax=Peronosclerospora sorghi TaxID=230839 RepID=A0ACC0VMS5_9STRA|nr:hypothetical protein PsorP6_002762 [Peronosclerospora sorghi]
MVICGGTGHHLIRDDESFECSDELTQTLTAMGKLLVTSATKIGAIVAQRRSSNTAFSKPLPSCWSS